MSKILDRFNEDLKKTFIQNENLFINLKNKASAFASRQVLYSLLGYSFRYYQLRLAKEILREEFQIPKLSWRQARIISPEKAIQIRNNKVSILNAKIADSFGLLGLLTKEQIDAIAFKARKNIDREYFKVCLKIASVILTEHTKELIDWRAY